jgi:chitin disaccharide deacetylase
MAWTIHQSPLLATGLVRFVKAELLFMGIEKAQISFSLCADDYALSPGVSLGILEALRAGRLTATSVLVTRPSWPSGADALRECNRGAGNAKADVGLHLNLTLGSPLGPMPAFAPSGRFPELAKAVKAAVSGTLPRAEIGEEIARQIDKFCEHFGTPPDFVDGHCHIQILPQIRRQLFAALEEKGLLGRVWLRNSSDSLARILRRNAGEFKKALGIAWLGQGFAGEAAARGFLTNEGFAGFSAFCSGCDYAAAFARYLRAPGKRHLVMCHPGYCDSDLVAVDSATLSREQELRFLLSSAFTEILSRKGATLARLSDYLRRN